MCKPGTLWKNTLCTNTRWKMGPPSLPWFCVIALYCQWVPRSPAMDDLCRNVYTGGKLSPKGGFDPSGHLASWSLWAGPAWRDVAAIWLYSYMTATKAENRRRRARAGSPVRRVVVRFPNSLCHRGSGNLTRRVEAETRIERRARAKPSCPENGGTLCWMFIVFNLQTEKALFV